jgi:hypothetical protein
MHLYLDKYVCKSANLDAGLYVCMYIDTREYA